MEDTKKFIEKVIEDIKVNPDNWTSKWLDYKPIQVNDSIQNKSRTIQIYKDGTFLSPSGELNLYIEDDQKDQLIELVDNIRKKETFECLKLIKI